MKVLLKKEVCGSIEQYTGPTKKALVLLKCASQKKKGRGEGGGGRRIRKRKHRNFHHYPNRYLVLKK